MRAAVLRDPRPIEQSPLSIENVTDPRPGQGEVLLRVRACGVCRSNLHMIEGDWMPQTPTHFPIIPGHEVVGEVLDIGDMVANVALGDRVGVQPLWSTCGHCEHCLTGAEQRCRNRQITGEHRDGGYAELMLANADFTVPIPDNVSDTEAAPLLCPGVTAYSSVKKAAISPGQRVGVVGIGGVGHVVVQLAALTGAQVFAISRDMSHRSLALKLGAEDAFAPSYVEGNSLPDGTLDAVVVFAPSAEAVAEAIRITKPGARIVLGVPQAIPALDVGDEKVVLTSVLGTRWEMREVLRLASEGKVQVVHSDHPLADANEVLQGLKAGSVEARAVLVP